MSVNIKSHLDSNFWNINMNGELDVAGADKVKEHLNGLVEKKQIDIKIDCTE